jgi:hypothetical protein
MNKLLSGIIKERGRLEDLDVNGTMIMKRMLENECVELNWIRILYKGGLSVNLVLNLREISEFFFSAA